MLSIQTDYSTLTAVLGRRAHSHREALSSAAFVADQVLRSCSSYGEDSLDALKYMHGEWWSPCIYRRNQNDSSPLELQLRRTLRRHSECASAQKGGTLAASYLHSAPSSGHPCADARDLGESALCNRDVHRRLFPIM